MAFDAARFLNTTYEAEFDTKRPLMPEGDWRCFIKSVDVAAGNRDDTVQLRLTLLMDDPDLAAMEQFLGRAEILMNTMIFVDVEKETQLIRHGGGYNWQLGAIRAACGQNNPAQPWAPAMLENKGPLLIRVIHSEIKKEGPNGRKEGTGEYRDNISAWAAA